MDSNYFINYLKERVALDRESEAALCARIKELTIVKGSNLLYPGDVCKYLYFVKTGFFRVYTSDGFEDRTIDFATTDQFLTAIESFFQQKVTDVGIVCEETALVWRISFHDWHALEDYSPRFLNLTKKVLMEHVIRINQEKNIYRTSNATQKYIHLGKQYPGIANIISQKHIANYLGITGPTLSNLLKDIFRKRK